MTSPLSSPSSYSNQEIEAALAGIHRVDARARAASSVVAFLVKDGLSERALEIAHLVDASVRARALVPVVDAALACGDMNLARRAVDLMPEPDGEKADVTKIFQEKRLECFQ